MGLCEVAWHMFNASTAYSVNLLAVSLVAVGCTIQQSSFYGFASMLPKKYPQAVMVGESLAGFLVSSNHVVTKLLIDNNRVSTMIFFLTSSFYIAISYVLHSITHHSPFVKYHTKACAKIVLRPYDDSHLEINDNHSPTTHGPRSETKYGVLSVDNPGSPTQAHLTTTTALSFSNTVYELSNPSAGENTLEAAFRNTPERPAKSTVPNVAQDKVEHIITPTCSSGHLGNFKSGLESRWRVAHAIYPYMCCIALAYCVTLSLYPGLESEIKSCKLKTWMPVLLMFTFNTADMLGKILAAVPYNWSRRQLTLLSGLRTLLVPLLLLCCTPRERPVISGETPAFIFTAALGLSNGLAGSLPMMLAPSKVPASLKEVAGNMMTLSYNVGLTIGSLLGYMFDAILGPQIDKPCPTFPYAPTQERNTTLAPATTVSVLYTTFLVSTTSYSSQQTTSILTQNASNEIAPLTTTIASILSSTVAAVLTTIPQIFDHRNTSVTPILVLQNNTAYQLSETVMVN